MYSALKILKCLPGHYYAEHQGLRWLCLGCELLQSYYCWTYHYTQDCLWPNTQHKIDNNKFHIQQGSEAISSIILSLDSKTYLWISFVFKTAIMKHSPQNQDETVEVWVYSELPSKPQY